ncbi:MAG: 50S ribosomal protein L6 [Planctomycetes bacterium]|nr:50S ribosomal protein L6 [Planctomycetota bacterium]
MSRIGKKPLNWSGTTKVSLSGNTVTVEGGKTKLDQWVDECLEVAIDGDKREAVVKRRDESARTRAMHGLYRTLLANMIEGIEKGFVKRLLIEGVGYSAKLDGKTLVLNIGFNAPVKMPVPAELSVEVPAPTQIVVKGADKQKVGQFAADVRAVRKPEPYKGKGIRYDGERVRRKVGKAMVG